MQIRHARTVTIIHTPTPPYGYGGNELVDLAFDVVAFDKIPR